MTRHFSDLRELPSLVPSYIRNATAHAVAPELGRRITRLSNLIDSGSVDTDSNSNGTSPWLYLDVSCIQLILRAPFRWAWDSKLRLHIPPSIKAFETCTFLDGRIGVWTWVPDGRIHSASTTSYTWWGINQQELCFSSRNSGGQRLKVGL